MSDSSINYIAITGKTQDVGFMAAILRAQKIPYNQALTFSRKPILRISQSHATQLQSILDEHHAQHPISYLSAEEVSQGRELLWVMLFAVVGILSIAWGRYFIRKLF